MDRNHRYQVFRQRIKHCHWTIRRDSHPWLCKWFNHLIKEAQAAAKKGQL